MNIMDSITGFSRNTEHMDSALFSTLLEAQGVRVYQSHRVLPLLLLTGPVYVYGLWQHAPHFNLVLWMVLVAAFAILRVLVCRHVQQTLADISQRQLYRNELSLFFTSLASTIAVGSGYWLVCYAGSDRAVLAVTVFCCIYAIGTTINSSIVYRSFPLMLIANLGQGVVFLSIIRDPVDIEVAVGLGAILVLLLEFGRKNASLFTESIRMRDENREQNVKLEQDRIIIEEALKAARTASEDKSRFLAAASHDLRQPLHAMTLFLGSLRHVATSALAVELIDKIDETSNILRDQFNSLLDLSKFDAGVVYAENSVFHLDALLGNIVDGVRTDAKKKSLNLELVALPIDLNTDMLLLERLLRNLVVNAVTYTDAGKITVAVGERRDGVHVSVVDTGPGIAPHDQEKIFEDYCQLNNPARTKSKGTGLGLAIAKRICHVLGFKLTLTSTPGSGSKFSVFIPAKYMIARSTVPRTQDVENRERLQDVSLAGMRILLVDDDPVILDALSRLLCLWECIPFPASSSKEVRSLLHQGQVFDMAILDDMLDEEATGLDIARYISSFIPQERVIITTGNMVQTRLDEISDSGFQLLIKPVDHLLLRQSLQELCTLEAILS